MAEQAEFVALPSYLIGSRRGYTLVEALIVVMVVGLLTAIALPRISMSTYQASTGARVVATTLSYAQRQAISQQADIRIAFDVVNRTMRVHEDRDNDNAIDAGERVRFTPLPEAVTFGRGSAAARPIGAAVITFIQTQGGFPVLAFHRDGSASEEGGVYVTTVSGLAADRTADVRSVEVARATGRSAWFSYATGTWKRGV